MISALVAYRPTRDGHRDEAWRREVPYLELVCDEVIVEAPEPAELETAWARWIGTR